MNGEVVKQNTAYTNVPPGADAPADQQIAYWKLRAQHAEAKVNGLTIALVQARGGNPVLAKTRMSAAAKGPGE